VADVYPANLLLEGRLCVVIGGGAVAARKIDSLLGAHATVRVVSPEVTPHLAALIDGGRVEWRQAQAIEADLADAFLVILATDDSALNARLARAADAAGKLVNAADQPEVCSFHVPASIRRGPLMLTVSTGGASPALARRIREELEAHFGPEYGELAELLGRLRQTMDQDHRSQAERARAWERVVNSRVLHLLRDGRPAEAEALARQLLALGKE
jgi:precorrin-2 dehydrogenase/sirohydrochlorin ferrochelatase